ncbi:hypothetical protein EVAR_79462_1 [Eumeta japonica]|uniref:Uncharacterized protein n=1 Tax=Eumeta variegata TaxID=151549 RepID=A0A4C1UF55_EUMVA|nr:hypothetical protein EVAR_79462_1 [Eumeta japonica]
MPVCFDHTAHSAYVFVVHSSKRSHAEVTWLQHLNEPARPVQHPILTENRREATVPAVAFCPTPGKTCTAFYSLGSVSPQNFAKTCLPALPTAEGFIRSDKSPNINIGEEVNPVQCLKSFCTTVIVFISSPYEEGSVIPMVVSNGCFCRRVASAPPPRFTRFSAALRSRERAFSGRSRSDATPRALFNLITYTLKELHIEFLHEKGFVFESPTLNEIIPDVHVRSPPQSPSASRKRYAGVRSSDNEFTQSDSTVRGSDGSSDGFLEVRN